MSDSWKTFLVFLSNSVPYGILSLLVVIDSMYNWETRRKYMGIETLHYYNKQRVGEQVKVEILRGAINPEVNHMWKISSIVIIQQRRTYEKKLQNVEKRTE